MVAKKRVVLITGASRGLGLALAQLLISKNKYHVILTARDSSLQRFAEAGITESEFVWLRPLDVLIKKERDDVIDEANHKLGGIDILINNAAYMLRAVVEHVGEVERFKQMDTNFRGPMALIRNVLPSMRKKRAGHIINISSVSGMMAMPTMSIYSASKFALEGATESLWYEVKPWKIRVTLVQPGFINSDSYMNVKHTKESKKAMADKNSPYYHHYNAMEPFISRLMKLSPATVENVALVVLKTMEKKRPPLRVAGTLDAHLFFLLRRLLPRSLYHTLLYFLLPKVLRWGKIRYSESY